MARKTGSPGRIRTSDQPVNSRLDRSPVNGKAWEEVARVHRRGGRTFSSLSGAWSRGREAELLHARALSIREKRFRPGHQIRQSAIVETTVMSEQNNGCGGAQRSIEPDAALSELSNVTARDRYCPAATRFNSSWNSAYAFSPSTPLVLAF